MSLEISDLSGPALKKAPETLFSGGGSMGELMRAFDWANSALGPVEHWPQSLKTSVSTCLNSRFAILIWWGKDLVKLYNDAYAPILGNKHPRALGAAGKDVWPEIWHIIGPMLDGVMERGEATWSDNLLLELERNGYPEECYFTFSYSPIHDETGGVGGVFTPVQETTAQVVGERRLRTLRDLADAARAANAQTTEDVFRVACETLAENPYDIPFAGFYLIVGSGDQALLSARTGISEDSPALPRSINLNETDWPFAAAAISGIPQTLDLLCLPGLLPSGAWPAAPIEAMIQPLSPGGQQIGFLVLAASPRKRLDEDYRGFLSLVGRHVTTAVAEARAFEQERKRAEALAELDRAKTQFFSNISHEFRTPLTLLLSPVEDALNNADTLTARGREALEIAHRNALRLLRLVNSLLDFSRIEAGRATARYQPVDLGSLTADLASSFRSATGRAGLSLDVDCPPLGDQVYVDTEMWEKVVLNLLSNAFKFTFEGGIIVRLRRVGQHAELTVHDTGTGIPPDQLSRVFERFHRVEGTRGRTHEGTGIGLALVQELVRLQGGSIHVESELNRGSTFTVTLPFGRSHLPAEQIAGPEASILGTSVPGVFADEAARWLPGEFLVSDLEQLIEEPARAPIPASGGERKGRVLLVDDNPDMLLYVKRLLSGAYDVSVASNGQQALALALASPPDLVLSDIMMPVMDGFTLLNKLRSDPVTQAIPVILLSARAGEESRSEGMDAGADDYLVKPFSARELLARVGSHLNLAKARKEVEQQSTRILESITDGFFALDRDWRFTYVNAEAERLNGMRREDMLGRSYWELFPSAAGAELHGQFVRAATERVAVEFQDYYAPWDRWFHVKAYPGAEGGLSVYFTDITDRKRAENAIKESEEELRFILEAGLMGSWVMDLGTLAIRRSPQHDQIFGYTVPPPEWTYETFLNHILPEDRREVEEQFRLSLQGAGDWEFECRVYRIDGEIRWIWGRGRSVSMVNGRATQMSGVIRDITDSKVFEDVLRTSNEELRRANRELEKFAYVASHDLQEPLRMVNIYTQLLMRRFVRNQPEAQEYADMVCRGVSRMEELIRDLLTYSRVVHSDDLEGASADLAAALEDATSVLEARIAETHARITAGPLPVVRGETAQLSLVFQNLLSNSIKYCSAPPEIAIAAEWKGSEWVVSVRDNGIGFEQQYATKVFGLFKRLHRDEYPGTGLGLAICQRIVERYRGRIWAESKPGEGSAFFFALPSVEAE